MYKHVCFHTYIATCGAKAAKEIRMYGIEYYKGKKTKNVCAKWADWQKGYI